LPFTYIGRNITERKNGEKALIESKKHLHHLNTYLEAIINASPFAIVDLYPDGRLSSLEPSSRKHFWLGKRRSFR
jgi:PAS domain-containing protein